MRALSIKGNNIEQKSANCPYLKVGSRAPGMIIDYSEPQLKFG